MCELYEPIMPWPDSIFHTISKLIDENKWPNKWKYIIYFRNGRLLCWSGHWKYWNVVTFQAFDPTQPLRSIHNRLFRLYLSFYEWLPTQKE